MNSDFQVKLNEIIDESLIMNDYTRTTDFESGKSVLKFKIDLNQNLETKYVALMSKNQKIDPIAENEENTKLIKKKTQLQL